MLAREIEDSAKEKINEGLPDVQLILRQILDFVFATLKNLLEIIKDQLTG